MDVTTMTPEELVAAYKGMALKMAYSFAGMCKRVGYIDSDDLYSVGLFSLFSSRELFDPSRANFTTFAYLRMRKAMTRAVCPRLRREGADREPLPILEVQADQHASVDAADAVARYSANLTPTAKRILRVMLENDVGPTGASKVLGMGENNAMWHYRKAIVQMKNLAEARGELV